MATFNPPAVFLFKPNEYLQWLGEFARFRIATTLHKEEGDVQRDSLLYAMGRQQTNRIFRTLTFVAPDVDTKYETLSLVSKSIQRQSRQQLANESVENCARELQTLANIKNRPSKW